jgi:hypothetical protein
MADNWENLEEKLDQAITELMFDDGKDGAPTLGVLRGILKTPGAVPAAAEERAKELLRLSAGAAYPGWVESSSDTQRIDLANGLVSFLRFVCKRGKEDA